MSQIPFLHALAVLCILFPCSPAWGAAAGQGDAAVLGKARALVKQGRHIEVLTVLRPLAARRTVPNEALFLIGLAGVEASQRPGLSDEAREALLDASIEALRTMLVRDPALVRARLELGRAFFLKGEDSLARRHFERVLAGKPPAAVALNIGRFMAQMRARKRWSVRVGFALAPDTNLGGGSDERIIYIPFGGQRLPFRRDQKELTKSGIGIVAWAGGEYQYPLGREWRLRAGGDVSRREYRNDEFDRMTVSGHLGPRWLVGRATEASLLAVARQSWLSDEADYRDLGLQVEARRRLTPRMTANARVSRVERRYDERDHLDGPVTDVSLGADHVLSPTVRADLTVGWGKEKPELKGWRNTSRWMRAGMTFALPWGFTVGGSGTLRWADYEGNWFPYTEDGSPRSDLTRSFRVDVHNRGFTVGGFSPQVSLVREDRTSNAQLHDYERTSGELRFVRLF